MMTGFVDRIIPANHSAGRNMKRPICREMDSQGKASTIRCGVCSMEAKGDTRKKPVKGGSIEMEKIIVDFVVICLKSNSKN